MMDDDFVLPLDESAQRRLTTLYKFYRLESKCFTAYVKTLATGCLGRKPSGVSCKVLFTPPIRSAECISVIESFFINLSDNRDMDARITRT